MVTALLILGFSVCGLSCFLLVRKESSVALRAPLHKDILCPSCKSSLHIEGMLDAAVFWGPGAIVFDCSYCHDRVYFSPYESHIETGILGCSPVLDPIPLEDFSYPSDFDMTSNIQEGILKIKIKEQSWIIPRYGLWNERTDIPCPSPAAKKVAPHAERSLP